MVPFIVLFEMLKRTVSVESVPPLTSPPEMVMPSPSAFGPPPPLKVFALAGVPPTTMVSEAVPSQMVWM